MNGNICFIDTETTGLGPDCEWWELGLIERTPVGDREYLWQRRPGMAHAEPMGLRIGRYYDRTDAALVDEGAVRQIFNGVDIPADKRHVNPDRWAAADIAQILDGATIVGAVPWFDTVMIDKWLRANGQAGTWNYHLVDVETLAAGQLVLPPPWNFDKLLAAYGLVHDEADRHSALGDAKMARDLFDAVMSRIPITDADRIDR